MTELRATAIVSIQVDGTILELVEPQYCSSQYDTVQYSSMKDSLSLMDATILLLLLSQLICGKRSEHSSLELAKASDDRAYLRQLWRELVGEP